MLKKISHIMLSFLLLVSTVGLTINFHYCHNSIYDIGIYSKAISCCEIPVEGGSHYKMHFHGINSNNDHCQDKTLAIESVDNFVSSNNILDINIESFTNLYFVYSDLLNVFSSLNTASEKIPLINILPPGTHHILALFQAYLL